MLHLRRSDAKGKRAEGPVRRGVAVAADDSQPRQGQPEIGRSEEHTSELQSLMRISYAVFCLKKKTNINLTRQIYHIIKNSTQSHITRSDTKNTTYTRLL